MLPERFSESNSECMSKKMKDKEISKGEVVFYKTPDGKPQLEVKLDGETVWLTQKQLAALYGVDRSVVTKHIKNIFKDRELIEKSVSAKIAHTAEDGKKYQVSAYNLDMIISVGYRVNSKSATQFRIWATKALREYLIKGYVVNEKKLKGADLDGLEKTIGFLRSIANSKRLKSDEARGLANIIADYTNSWILLQKFDQEELKMKRGKLGKVVGLDYQKYKAAIESLKYDLAKKKEATELFGRERGKSFEAIIGNVRQSFAGQELYDGTIAKAVHLFYFIIKDHPFTDGNKRIASFLFIVFLAQNMLLYKRDGERKINENALVALALLVAESSPRDKDLMVALITNLL